VSFFLPAIAGLVAYTGLRLSRPRLAPGLAAGGLEQTAMDEESGPEPATVS
jgi:hypothetical protein